VVIFCYTEFHRVLHGVTQSFFSFVLLCGNFLLHRVTRSFARSFTEFFFPPCYFVIIFCYTEFHRVLHGVTQSFFSSVLLCDNFLLHRPSQSVIVSSVLLCGYSVKLFFIAHSLSESFFSSVLLCEYSVVLCETFFYCTQSLRELFFLCATL